MQLTETFIPSRGVRQGCPLSALLFILCVEVLSNSIRQDKTIKGLVVGRQTEEIKLAQLADDMTIFVQDIKSGEKAIKVIEKFSTVSGINLNKNKTKAMWLGEICPVETIGNINWSDTFVKSLGIYFSKNKVLSKELNWSQDRFTKIKQILDSWKQRNLTYKGKIIILKSLVISKLTYTAQIVPCPHEWVNQYDKLFQKFLWGNRAKVKKENMINSIQDGGLNMIDIHTQFMSLNVKWLLSFLSSKESNDKTGKWKILFSYWIETIGGIDIVMNSKCPPKYITSIRGKIPDFYYELFYTWFTVKQAAAVNTDRKQLSYNTVMSEMLWLNKDITYRGRVLMFRNWIRSNILFVGDIVGVNGFLRNNELKHKLVYKDGRWLSEYARLRSALKPQWVECLITNRQKDTCTSRNCESYQQALSYSKVFLIKHEVAIDFVKLKQIYAELIKLKQNSSRAMQFWNEVLHPETSMKWRSLWLYRLKYVRDKSLIQFNFTFMYKYLTNTNKSV